MPVYAFELQADDRRLAPAADSKPHSRLRLAHEDAVALASAKTISCRIVPKPPAGQPGAARPDTQPRPSMEFQFTSEQREALRGFLTPFTQATAPKDGRTSQPR